MNNSILKMPNPYAWHSEFQYSRLYLYLFKSVLHDTCYLRIVNSANKASVTEKGDINALIEVL